MAERPKKYTVADHCLINAATEMSIGRVRNDSVIDDALATFRDVLPEVTRENLMIGDLAEACDEMIEHYYPKRNSAGLTAAQFHLASALEKVHRWKHAQAVSAWQQSKGKTQ